MGYYVTVRESNVYLPREFHGQAFNRFMAMSEKYDHVKRGGSSTGARWFSWMNDYETVCKTAADVIDRLGFSTYTGTNGELVIEGYDSKIGQEDLFFNEIADLLSPGYIEWQGEDGDLWRWVFDGETMEHVTAKVVWE